MRPRIVAPREPGATPTRPRPSGPPHGLLALQRTAGNRAATALVQRCGPAKPDCDCAPEDRPAVQRIGAGAHRLTVEERRRDLTNPRYAGDPRLQAAFDNDPLMRRGERGPAVALVQRGLVDDGFALPRSTGPTGELDGIFGGETLGGVLAFQRRYHLPTPDGTVGRQTLGALDALGGGAGVPPRPCLPGPVSTERDALPQIPPPTVRFMSAPAILDEVNRLQPRGAVIPSKPPLGATVVRPFRSGPVVLSTVPDGSCRRCLASWEPPVPQVELLIATGDFADEKRFWVTQQGDGSGCPTGPIPVLKDVRKVIRPEAVAKALLAELEHWADFRRAFQIAAGRDIATVRRLTPDRSHLLGVSEQDCRQKVEIFLAQSMGDPLVLVLFGRVVELFDQFVEDHVNELYAQSGAKRDAGPAAGHQATPQPPPSRAPFPPDIDTARNPFGCAAFWRRFDASSAPGVPGDSPETVILDTGLPTRQPWHAL